MLAKILITIGALILFGHGLIHFIGTAAYMQLAEIDALPYRTTLLGGRWDIGDPGMRVFGALWGLAALGFVVASVALLIGEDWWRTLALQATLVSLVVTGFDWNNAYAGSIVDIAILVLLFVL